MALLEKYTLDKAAAELSLLGTAYSVSDVIGMAANGKAEICVSIEYPARTPSYIVNVNTIRLFAGEWIGNVSRQEEKPIFDIRTKFGNMEIRDGFPHHHLYFVTECYSLLTIPQEVLSPLEPEIRRNGVSDQLALEGNIFCSFPKNSEVNVCFPSDGVEHSDVDVDEMLFPLDEQKAVFFNADAHDTIFYLLGCRIPVADLFITNIELARLKSLIRESDDKPGKDDLSSLTGAKKAETLPESDYLFPASKWKCTAQTFTKGALEDNKELHDNLLGDDANKFQEAKSDLIGKIYTHLFNSAALGNDNAKTNRGHSPSKNSVDKEFLTPYIIHLKKQKKTK